MLHPLLRRRAAAGQQYAIIVGLIGVVALASIGFVGNSMQTLFSGVSNRLSNVAVPAAAPSGGGGGGGPSDPFAGRNYKLIFVTTETYPADFATPAGVAGLTKVRYADSLCQASAQASGFSGTYRAWFTDSSGLGSEKAPVNRFNPSSLEYRTPAGGTTTELVGLNWTNLITQVATGTNGRNNVRRKDGVRPVGSGQDQMYWSNTSADGTDRGLSACNNWTSNSSGATSANLGCYGTGFSYVLLSDCSNIAICSITMPLMCVEQ